MTAPVNYISPSAKIGKGTKVWHFAFIGDDTEIGEDCMIGSLCHIDLGIKIHNRVRIQGNCHLSKGCVVEDNVFIGPNTTTTNDRYPMSDHIQGVHFEQGCIIGAGAKILAGVRIGQDAVVSMGSVVTKDVQSGIWVAGVPARPIGTRHHYEDKKQKFLESKKHD